MKIKHKLFKECNVKFDETNKEHVKIDKEYIKLDNKINLLLYWLTLGEVSYGYVTHPEIWSEDKRAIKNMKINNPTSYNQLIQYKRAIRRENVLIAKINSFKEK